MKLAAVVLLLVVVYAAALELVPVTVLHQRQRRQ